MLWSKHRRGQVYKGKLGRHEGCTSTNGILPCFLFSDFLAYPSASIYSSGGKEEGKVKGLYTPHSWTLIGLFTTHGVLWVRKCSSWFKSSESAPAPSGRYPVLGPVCDWPKCSPVQTDICCLRPPMHRFWIGDLKRLLLFPLLMSTNSLQLESHLCKRRISRTVRAEVLDFVKTWSVLIQRSIVFVYSICRIETVLTVLSNVCLLI